MFYSTTNRSSSLKDAGIAPKLPSPTQNETDRVIVLALSKNWQSPEGSSTKMLGLHDFLQRKAAANDQGRALGLHQLLLLEFGKQAAHRLARRADDLGDLFVG